MGERPGGDRREERDEQEPCERGPHRERGVKVRAVELVVEMNRERVDP